MGIKKIAFRGGHNYSSPGCKSRMLDEVTEDRKVLSECLRIAKEKGYQVLDCTPGNCDANTDLYKGVQAANSWGADIYVPLHFNKCYDYYAGKIGTEVWVYSHNKYGASIVKELSDLTFRNRGQKVNPNLYDLSQSKMVACLVEVCFVEATGDVELYKKLTPTKIAEAIVRGIANADGGFPEVESSPAVQTVRWDYKYDAWVEKLQNYLNQRGHNVQIDGIAGDETYNAIKGYTLSYNERATLAWLVQERLNNMGFNAGTVDGIVGDKTYAAIKAFQKANGLGQGYLGGTDWYYLIR